MVPQFILLEAPLVSCYLEQCKAERKTWLYMAMYIDIGGRLFKEGGYFVKALIRGVANQGLYQGIWLFEDIQ